MRSCVLAMVVLAVLATGSVLGAEAEAEAHSHTPHTAGARVTPPSLGGLSQVGAMIAQVMKQFGPPGPMPAGAVAGPGTRVGGAATAAHAEAAQQQPPQGMRMAPPAGMGGFTGMPMPQQGMPPQQQQQQQQYAQRYEQGPPQGMPPQGMPQQGMPPQGMPQGMPPQGFGGPAQFGGMPPQQQGMPPQGFPQQRGFGGPPQGFGGPSFLEEGEAQGAGEGEGADGEEPLGATIHERNKLEENFGASNPYPYRSPLMPGDVHKLYNWYNWARMNSPSYWNYWRKFAYEQKPYDGQPYHPYDSRPHDAAMQMDYAFHPMDGTHDYTQHDPYAHVYEPRYAHPSMHPAYAPMYHGHPAMVPYFNRDGGRGYYMGPQGEQGPPPQQMEEEQGPMQQ